MQRWGAHAEDEKKKIKQGAFMNFLINAQNDLMD